MIESARLAAYVATEFGLFLAPGPSVVFVVANGAARGWRVALGAVAANTVGLLIQLVVVVVVLGAAVHSGALSETLKLVGAGWLIYLGARTLARRGVSSGAEDRSRSRLLRDGVVVGLTNPKGLITFTGFAPDVVNGGGGRTVSLALLGLLGVAVAVICDTAWGLAAGAGQTLLAGHRRALDLTTGVLMIGFGVGLAIITLL